MRPVSDQFLATLRTPHLVVAAGEIRFPGATEWTPVPVVSGQVTMDRTAPVTRSGSVTIPWSLQAGANLGVDLRTLPFGGYCRLYRGVRYADRTTEMCLLGTFRIESVTWRTDDTATLELADRMAQVRDEPFRAPYMPQPKPTVVCTGTVTDGSTLITAITPNTTGLTAGMAVNGPAIPPGTIIVSVDSASQVTVNQPLSTTVQANALMRTSRKWLAKMGTVAGIVPGMTVTSPTSGDIAAGTLVTAVYNPAKNGHNVDLNKEPLVNASRALNFTLGTGGPAAISITFGGNVTIGQAIGEIVWAVFGDQIAYQTLYDPPYTLNESAYTGSRTDAIVDLATGAGGFPTFDANGDWLFTDQPNTGDEPVWDVDAGETGVLVSDEEALDRTGLYNGVLVTGQTSVEQPPLQALVVDDDPASPTRWGGPYGKVCRIEQSSSVSSVAQAEVAATALLNSRLGLSRSLTLTAAPNPALEPGDVVTVRFADGRVETHIVDTIQLGLEAAMPQQLATRSQWTPAAAATRWAPLPDPKRTVYVGDAAYEVARNARLVAA